MSAAVDAPNRTADCLMCHTKKISNPRLNFVGALGFEPRASCTPWEKVDSAPHTSSMSVGLNKRSVVLLICVPCVRVVIIISPPGGARVISTYLYGRVSNSHGRFSCSTIREALFCTLVDLFQNRKRVHVYEEEMHPLDVWVF